MHQEQGRGHTGPRRYAYPLLGPGHTTWDQTQIILLMAHSLGWLLGNRLILKQVHSLALLAQLKGGSVKCLMFPGVTRRGSIAGTTQAVCSTCSLWDRQII